MASRGQRGISAWTLLSQFEERAKHLGEVGGDFADGKLNIPENKEWGARHPRRGAVEIEFMLRMQVPPNNPLAGMVHHKIRDEKWTALHWPHPPAMKRYLRPPSTAATPNLAATAAEAARDLEAIDPAFSSKCLTAAGR